jgi:hypothetical protein
MIIHPVPTRPSRFGLPRMLALGGDRVVGTLARRLDDDYHYFRNVHAGAGAAIDSVVVGPGGTWAFTRCELRERVRRRNGHWYRWNRSTDSWIPWDAVPVNEARLAGHRLELYLERAGLPAAVEASLLVAGGGEITWDPDQHAGIHVHDDLEQLAVRVARDEALTPAQVDRIVALLDPRQPLPRLATSVPGS